MLRLGTNLSFFVLVLCGTSSTAAQGLLSVTATPSSLNFGNVAAGTGQTQSVQLGNSGLGPVSLLQVKVSGTGFGVNGPSLPILLLPGQKAGFTVTFSPNAAGNFSGALSVTSTATNSPTTVSLAGTGTQLLLSESPSSLNFGSLMMGQSASLPVTLTNSGSGTVTIYQANASGAGFSVAGLSLPLTLAPGQKATYQVTFAPAASGSASGSVSVVSNASNSPTGESLAGTGVHAVTLSWQASASSVAGYIVYRATGAGGPYARVSSSLVTGTNFIDETVQAGAGYYYVVTATDSGGNESPHSNEAFALVPNS